MEALHPVDEFLLAKEAAENKEAGFLGNLWNAFAGGVKRVNVPSEGFATAGQGLMRSVGEALPGAVASASIAAIGVGGAKGIGAIRERFRKQRDYKAMLSAAPALKKRPAGQVQLMYNSLRKLSPTLASDPVTAGSFIDNAMELSGGKAVMPTQTAKLLAEAQKAWTQGKKRPGAIQQAFAATHQWDRPEKPPEGVQATFGPSGPTMRGAPEEAAAAARRYGLTPEFQERPPEISVGRHGAQVSGLRTKEEAEAAAQQFGLPMQPPPEPAKPKGKRTYRPKFYSGPVQPSVPRQVAGWEPEREEEFF